MAAEPEQWPKLPETEFISSRVAIEADVKAGKAVFYQQGGGEVVRPLPISVPQYARLKTETGERVAVVVVQAEHGPSGDILGMRDAGGKEYVATLEEVTLLGHGRPGEKESK